MKFSKYVTEGLSARIKNVQLNKSSIKDKHIQDAIDLIAKAKGVSRDDIENQFKMHIKKATENYGTSPISKNEIANLAESVAQEYLQSLSTEDLDLSKYGIEDPEEDLLDSDFFFDLTQYVLGENAQFFPLKNPFEKKAVKPYFYITPDNLPSIVDPALKNAAQRQCKTAFCTPNAEMVFNRKFCEGLALSALIKGVKPKSKKYVSNGGDIPDHYCYLEFVIMHELLHFSAGDHFYTKPMVKKIQKKHPKNAGRAHNILNYVGDYINNWTLVKSGYEQLPMGLFSEKVNYDNYKSYEDIIDAVVEELFKISDEDWEKFIEQKEKSMDEHMDNPNDEPSSGGGESEPQDAPNQPQPKPDSTEPEQGEEGDDAQGGDSQDGDQATDQDGDQEGEPQDGDGSGSGSGGSGEVYKVGDIIRINKTGKKAKITSASEPDENGIQQLDIEEIIEERSEFISFINEKMISSADVSKWEDSTDSDDEGQSGDGDTGDSDGDSDDSEQGQGDGQSDQADDQADQDNEPQDGSGGGSGGEDGEDGEQDGDSDSSDSGGPSGEDSDSETPDNTDSPSDGGPEGEEKDADAQSQAIDDAMKQNQDKVDQRDDGNNDADAALDKKDKVSDDDIDKKVGSGTRTIDFKEVKTVVNWKKILKKMIPKGDGEIEDTYAKMSRQATSSMVSVMQTGAGRVSPGEVILDPTKRGLVFVIDNSGSVMRQVNKFNQEIMQLLKKHKKILDNMFIIKFSGDFEVNKVHIGSKIEYQRIMNPKAMVKKSGKIRFSNKKPITALFPETYGYTTDYTIEMHRIIEFLHTQNMNIILFTDDDLVRDERVKKFYKLSRKRRNSTAMFITDDRSYQNMIKKYGKYPWITVLK